jgi:membrane fusion protein, multidrug efflux system
MNGSCKIVESEYLCALNIFKMYRNYFLAVAASVAVYALQACGGGDENESAEVPQDYPVFEVFTEDIDVDIDYVADIEAAQNVEIRAKVEGYLERVYIDEGKTVSQGQLLFKLNDAEYRSELVRAQAAVKSAIAEAKAAQLEVDRIAMLVKNGVVSATELDLAKAKLEAIEAKIEEARSMEISAGIKVQNANITAPFNGIIDRIPFKVGSLIEEGTLLSSVSDLSSILVYFKVSELEYLDYFKRMTNKDTTDDFDEVILYLADGQEYGYGGKIETMESEFEESTGAIAFRARFQNPEGMLKHGSSGKIRVRKFLPKAVLIPQKSVVEIQDKNYVFILGKDNTVSMRSFVPKFRKGHYYVVDEGLKPGDRVVYEGVQSLRDGESIKPRMLTKEQVMNENIQ